MKHLILLSILLNTAFICTANLSGPFLFWGHPKVITLQPRALVEANERDFIELFEDTKVILIFLRNASSTRLDAQQYPKFGKLVNEDIWAYLPQYALLVDPFHYNANVETIILEEDAKDADNIISSKFHEAVRTYGKNSVLGILANQNLDADRVKLHVLSKREAKDNETSSNAEETDETNIYVADGKKAVLLVNTAPILNITERDNITLRQHQKSIQFDDQKAKGYGRLSIKFVLEKTEKVSLRFNFSLSRGTWSMKAVEVEYMNGTQIQYKNVLPIVGTTYTVPYAPVGFSYRCSARPLIFKNGSDTLILNDYQIQPWLNGSSKFGDVYDCVGFTTSAIWAGVLVTLFLCTILSIGLMALMDIKTPNRFESSRSKQLTFVAQE